MFIVVKLWQSQCMSKRKNIEHKNDDLSSSAYLASEEFHTRVRAYFYVVALIVSGQLIWMIDQSITSLDKGSIDVINKTPISELGFTDEQIKKMEKGWTPKEFSRVPGSHPGA